MVPLINSYHSIYVKLVIITMIGLITYFAPSPVIAATTSNIILIRLVDANNNPIARVGLTAWWDNTACSQAFGYTGKDGVASLNLPPGQYYFTGDVTELRNRAVYTKDMQNMNGTTFYFISKPISINEKTENIIVMIDNTNYINIVDLAGLQGFQVHIRQKDLGISTNIHVRPQHSCLRLYIPQRMQYIIEQVEGISHMQWPIYATPGSQFILPF